MTVTSTSTSDEVTLELGSIRRTPRGLAIQYELANRLEEDLYLFNHVRDYWGLAGKSPLRAPTDEVAQMCHAGGTTLLVLLGRVPLVLPPGVCVLAPRLPSAVLVASGHCARALIQVPLPLVEWSVYVRPVVEGSAVAPIEINRIRLEAEVALASDVIDAHELKAAPGLHHAIAHKYHRVAAEADVHDLQLILLRNTASHRPIL